MAGLPSFFTMHWGRGAGRYLAAGRSVRAAAAFRVAAEKRLFGEILRVGAVAALITVGTNATVAITTALVGHFGPSAIAGYGVGSRLEYLLVLLVFGLGSPLVAMVGTNIGVGRGDRALRTGSIGAAIALAWTIGLIAAAMHHSISSSTTTRQCSPPAARSIRTVGPCYGSSGSAWRFILPRKALASCAGR